MSCGYCAIAVAMSGVHLAAHGLASPATHGAAGDLSTADLVFGVFNALGSVAFTFGGRGWKGEGGGGYGGGDFRGAGMQAACTGQCLCTLACWLLSFPTDTLTPSHPRTLPHTHLHPTGQAVLPEIQATLARPPATAPTMMRGVGLSYVLVVVAYFGVAASGFAAFGAQVSSGAWGGGRFSSNTATNLPYVSWRSPTASVFKYLPAHPPAHPSRPACCLLPADVLLNIKQPAVVMHAANLMVVAHVAAAWQVRCGGCDGGRWGGGTAAAGGTARRGAAGRDVCS